MIILYELFTDLASDSEYRVNTILKFNKNSNEWFLYLTHSARYADDSYTDDMHIDEETAFDLLKNQLISSVEIKYEE